MENIYTYPQSIYTKINIVISVRKMQDQEITEMAPIVVEGTALRCVGSYREGRVQRAGVVGAIAGFLSRGLPAIVLKW